MSNITTNLDHPESAPTPSPQTSSLWQLSWPALTADLIGVLALFLLLPFLKEQFVTIPTRAATILLTLFFGMAIAVNRIKRLDVQPYQLSGFISKLDFTKNQTILAVLGVIAGFIFWMVQADLNQIANDLAALYGRDGYVHEGEITLYYSLGPAFMWFMVAAFYQAAFMLKTERRIPLGDSSYQITELWALTVINLYLVAFVAYLATFGSTWFAQPAVLVLASFVLLELIFDPARLRHAVKNGQWPGLVSFTVLQLLALVFVLV